MKKTIFPGSFLLVISFFLIFSESVAAETNVNLIRATSTLNTIYKYYGIKGSPLLRETYPYDEMNKVTYLANDEQNTTKNFCSYLWPYSGNLTAVSLLFEITKKRSYKNLLEKKVLAGLDQYLDKSREPQAYASYVKTASADRFYDDNIWIGIDFTDLYLSTRNQKYLAKALDVWTFIKSGTDDVLGGGIYWCEQNKGGKNSCSNAPGAVYALKLFEATNDSTYFYQGLNLYNWTKHNLQDSDDYLYFDNINLKGHVDKAKYAYNSGQMLQAAALLYKLTRQKQYLDAAEKIANSAYHTFFDVANVQNGNSVQLLKKGNIWFSAVMMRGYIELYDQNHSDVYIKVFKQNLDYAWTHMRDSNGLFNTDWSGNEKDQSKWLLTQFAMVEMYARLSVINVN